MTPLFLYWLAQLTAAMLLAFSLRRAILLLTACLPHTPTPPHSHREAPLWGTPTLTILIPCRNEARSLPRLLEALDRLDYPHDRWQIVIVDDGSTDHTAGTAQAWVAARPWARLMSLATNVGKAQALNEALTPYPRPLPPLPTLPVGRGGRGGEAGVGGEVVVIYDADHRPAPHSLRALVGPFADPQVAAVSGQMRVVNAYASPAAFYTLIESLVNQLITMRAKDRLNLAPALLGSNCAYRRSALEAVGGFRRGVLLEDSDLTLAFALAGRRTRFAPESVSDHHAPTSLAGHVRQHLRWNRGFHQAGGRLASLWADRHLSPWLKLELTFYALGYADRLALLAGALFTMIDLIRPETFGFPVAIWPIYFGIPALEMVAALNLARAPMGMFLRLAYVPFFFVLDAGIALWSSFQTLVRRPFTWSVSERSVAAQPTAEKTDA